MTRPSRCQPRGLARGGCPGYRCHQCRRVTGSKLNVHSVVFANSRGQRRGSARSGQRRPTNCGPGSIQRPVARSSQIAEYLRRSLDLNAVSAAARISAIDTGGAATCSAGTVGDGPPDAPAAVTPPMPLKRITNTPSIDLTCPGNLHAVAWPIMPIGGATLVPDRTRIDVANLRDVDALRIPRGRPAARFQTLAGVNATTTALVTNPVRSSPYVS